MKQEKYRVKKAFYTDYILHSPATPRQVYEFMYWWGNNCNGGVPTGTAQVDKFLKYISTGDRKWLLNWLIKEMYIEKIEEIYKVGDKFRINVLSNINTFTGIIAFRNSKISIIPIDGIYQGESWAGSLSLAFIDDNITESAVKTICGTTDFRYIPNSNSNRNKER